MRRTRWVEHCTESAVEKQPDVVLGVGWWLVSAEGSRRWMVRVVSQLLLFVLSSNKTMSASVSTHLFPLVCLWVFATL